MRLIQILNMKKYYSNFKVLSKSYKSLIFQGYLKPTNESENYLVNIEYRDILYPKAYVINKEINKLCKHLNFDNSLCLFHPNEFKWKEHYLLTTKFVPVIISWLYYYEKWEKFGVWYCDEYPHDLKEIA